MKHWLHHFFIPHAGNDYHPHLLHTKRAALYSMVFVAMKVIVVAFVLLVPVEVYVLPDVLAEQEKTLYALTNDVRQDTGVSLLTYDARLHKSAILKASDMASTEYFAHTAPDGKGLAWWMGESGYPYSTAGENLAIGFTDPRALVLAWVESPTHFANLIDSEYEDTGISLVNGMYEGVSVVYAVQHFGTEKKIGEIAQVLEPEEQHTFVETTEDVTEVAPEHTFGEIAVEKTNTDEVPVEEEAAKPLSEDTEKEEVPIALVDTENVTAIAPVVEEDTSSVEVAYLDRERSFVQYEKISEEQIRITASAAIQVPYTSALVRIGGDSIVLEESDAYGVVRGERIIDKSVESYFRAVLLPQISIVLEDGTEIKEPLRWEHIPKVSLTPVEQYTTSKSLLGSFTRLFDVTNGVYFFFIVLFSIALLIHMFWEIRVQHHHVTVQTLGLILLLITLTVI